MTDVDLSVFGHTVAIIGYPEQMKVARAAIDMLIEGVPHENVFAFLDKKKKEAKQDIIGLLLLRHFRLPHPLFFMQSALKRYRTGTGNGFSKPARDPAPGPGRENIDCQEYSAKNNSAGNKQLTGN